MSEKLIDRYNEIRPTLKTGDIVLFSGKGWSSRLIKWGTNSKWSHVGIVVAIPEWDLVFLWESNAQQKIIDLSTGKQLVGVQLVLLSEKIQNYQGTIAFRHLVEPQAGARDTFIENLVEFRKTVKEKPYEREPWSLARLAFWRMKKSPLFKSDNSSLFCSELIADAYQATGILSKELLPCSYHPGAFSEENNIPFLNGWKLGPEIPR